MERVLSLPRRSIEPHKTGERLAGQAMSRPPLVALRGAAQDRRTACGTGHVQTAPRSLARLEDQYLKDLRRQ
ncbi:MAG: hypothetical protein FWG14_13675 [Peptococcaceae bacterium]|nr:hypothetical protein [Peptococcaceae bacterium]